MIEETFLRQSIKNLKNGEKIYIYNEKFIDIIAEKYYEKYDKVLYLENFKDYFAMSTKFKGGNNCVPIKK